MPVYSNPITNGIMTKLNIILGLLLLLLLCNIFLFVQLMKPLRQKSPRDIIVTTLQLTESQLTEYDKLIQAHRSQIQQSDDRLRILKENLYSQLANLDSNRRDSLIDAIGSLHKKIEYTHWNHFKDIEALCLPNQKANFETLQKQMAQIFAHPHHPHRR
jgi:hypothetical protein